MPDNPNQQQALPAHLWRRLFAIIYDGLLIIAIWMVTTVILTLINRTNAVYGAWYQSIIFLEAYLFCAWFWIRNGATLGMQAWRLKVQTPAGRNISVWQSLVRFLMGIISALPMGLGYWWILIDPAKRSWGDIVSNTQIVRSSDKD